jgi:hypothetical protein
MSAHVSSEHALARVGLITPLKVAFKRFFSSVDGHVGLEVAKGNKILVTVHPGALERTFASLEKKDFKNTNFLRGLLCG